MQTLNEVSQKCPQCCCSCTTPFFNSTISSHNTTPPKLRNSSAEWRHSFAVTTTSSIFPNTQFTNHESLPSLHESFNEFTKVFPQYSDTEQVDYVRAKDYFQLSLSNQTCLDYIGIGLFCYSQLQHQLPSSSVPQTPQFQPNYSDIPFFSIHSKTGSLKTLLLHGGQDSEFEGAMRKRIMSFLNISENDYFMVFTANRTSAFKLVADSYQFQTSRRLLTVYDYESEAAEAMVSSSEKRGARAMSAEFSWPRLRIQSKKLRKMIESRRKKKKRKGLFVFPLGSRVTGARYPYLWMSIAQENGWHVLVDACALGPKDMDCFGLSLFQPDFLICSFYKVFGANPSGFGCLFIKKSAISSLESSPSAGIVNLVQDSSSVTDLELIHNTTSTSPHEEKKPFPLSSFSGPMQSKQSEVVEEGEPTDTNLKAPQCSEIEEMQEPVQTLEKSNVQESGIQCGCLDQVDSLGLILITNRSRYLINWLVNSMLKLKHPNTQGVPLVKIYGPKVKFDRGPALAFNIFDWKGERVEPVLVQKLADRSNISISYAFLHHIWFADKYAEEKGKVLQTKVVTTTTTTTNKKKKDRVGISVVTAALGFIANFEDVYKLWAFVSKFLDADFVEKERWRYLAINQKTIEV
ncbi:Pyridoxal phosphate-dependent transferase [Vigna unguiculata]|uniref:Pyridoxal phosphate-dependent transferase n=1 Tax=Vigna unguiculata TaxID=3917 RepID=A0A4D6M301_VIGUN|nr:Pyridoxal phosphate-dependent transferase [Vigna unguiculata]